MKRIDPLLIEILSKYGESVETATWDCHGTWVAYHKAIERIAAKAGVVYEKPTVLVAEREAAAILVTGNLGDRSEWSIGEAVINLNYRVSGKQAAYPFAMAEKRAKDRVVLKLIGLHGLVYSEEESEDFKADAEKHFNSENKPVNASKNDDARNLYATLETAMRMATTKAELRSWWQNPTNVSARNRLPASWQGNLRDESIKLAESLPEGHPEEKAA